MVCCEVRVSPRNIMAKRVFAALLAFVLIVQEISAIEELSRHKRAAIDDAMDGCFYCWTKDIFHADKKTATNCGKVEKYKGKKDGKDAECSKRFKDCCKKGDGKKCHSHPCISFE
ncbi:uncharacterized protein LOC129601340 [Paramacrobiotus metropolitanus]|uniref:uncharacterized protein LOC129601340 n=1 Tax=Paramacrobiotus metropolitanus TaxID=2943436 RepID=UPI002445C199|nr:uncharacterized protein LOC129601340 [Paramacrobiotus metropolitanus]